MTATYVLSAERERLADRDDDLAGQLKDADDSTSADHIRTLRQEVQAQGRGVAHLIDEHGPEKTVTVAALDAGEYALVEDRVAAMAQRSQGQAQGYQRNVFAAAGLRDGPFVDDDLTGHDSPRQRLDAALEIVTGLPPGVVKWLHSRVNEETKLDQGNWKASARDSVDTSGA